ncbi:ubiquitin-activating enzyme E1 1-like protein [Tanacetum coccineum]
MSRSLSDDRQPLQIIWRPPPTTRSSYAVGRLIHRCWLIYQEIVNIRLGDGSARRGQVLKFDGERAVVQDIDEDFHSRQLAVYGHETMRKLFGANVLISGMQALSAKTGRRISNMVATKKTTIDRVATWKPTTVLCMVSGYKANNYSLRSAIHANGTEEELQSHRASKKGISTERVCLCSFMIPLVVETVVNIQFSVETLLI